MSIRRVILCLSLAVLAVAGAGFLNDSRLSSQTAPPQETVIAGRNVNMVSGDTLPGGDPWLQRQNEPSIAVSSRNPLHLLAGANDYRTVDMPVSEGELPGKQPSAMVGDAWLGVFTSYDGGESWTSTMLPGYPQDPAYNPLKGYRTAADPVVRSGPNGLFYYSGIAFNRDTNLGVVFVARFIDDNNKEGGGTIRYIDTKIVAAGNASTFLDKPWIAVDHPRAPISSVAVAGQTVPRHNVYIAYSAFAGGTATVGNIMFARSNDCGSSWKAPIKISSGSYAHQGATIAIKPVLGEVLVAWRRFGQAGTTQDAIFVAQSFTRGLGFQAPVKVANVAPFDQPTTDETQSLPLTGPGFAFRTNSYPTMTVDKSGHVYLAWTQRGVGPSGSARVVISSSILGSYWTSPKPVTGVDENGLPFLGHQLMPSLSFAAGKLILVWYDQRYDVSATEYGYSNWILDDRPYRHTMDVWAAEADTSAFPTLDWKTSQISRYLYGMLQDSGGDPVYDTDGNPIVIPVQFNCVNYALFKGGHNAFMGDYIDVAAAPTFKLDTWRNWVFNTDGPESPVFHVAWTDNRDVRPPLDGNWANYVPPFSSQDPAFISSDPGRPGCGQVVSGNEPGMRNQNIYTSRITWGIEAGSPVNDKPLNLPGGVARAFVVFVKNNTGSMRAFRLAIESQPAGGQASFDQFDLLPAIDAEIAWYSTISRTVFISSSDPNASATVLVNEIDAAGNVVPGGLTGSILINGDPSNPQLMGGDETHDPEIVDPENPNIVNWYVNPNIVNPNIVNPNIVNPNIVNPNIVNPNIVNPNIVNPNIVNPNIVNPNIVNRDVPNPNIVNPNIVNPNIVNPNIVNASPEDVAITDVEWTVTNTGDTTTSYTLKALAKKSPPEGVYVQLLVYRVHYTPAVAGAELGAEVGNPCLLKKEPHHELVLNVVNPNIVNPNIVNPNIVNPNIVNASIENATFAVAPGEEVVVALRVLDTGAAQTQTQTAMMATNRAASAQAFSTQEFIDSLGFAVTSQAVNSDDAAQGIETPPADATDLVIGTASLPDGVVGSLYSAALSAYGGSGTYTWSLNSGELPPGLTLGAGGVISGTPTGPGSYQFIVRVDDGEQFDTQQYSVYVDSDSAPDVLTVATFTLPGGVEGHWYGATLEATGGTYPRVWSIASGALPDGLSLDSGGVISGTPISDGTYAFTPRVTDAAGQTATTAQSLSLTISQSTGLSHTISGTAYDVQGLPCQGAVLRGLPNTPVTDANGYYEDTVPEHWTGTVVPFKAGVAFSPSSRTYTDVTAPFSQQDYNQPMQNPVSTISGTVMYNGVPLPLYPSAQVSLWARNETTGQGFPITPTYNPTDGTYSLPAVPSGTYGIQVTVDAALPIDGKSLPGDYYGWTSPITVNAPNPVNLDLNCQKIIHLTAPVDNNDLPARPMPPPYDTFFPPTLFQWDAIAEAATYTIRVDKCQDDPYLELQYGILNVSALTVTQWPLSLPVCGANEHYEFNLFAYNANNVMVGQLMAWYSGGYGWDYRFKLVSPSPVSTLATNLEYPTGMWIRGDDLFIIESAGHNTAWGGKVSLDRFNIATGQLATLVTDPENAYAVAAGTGNDTNIYLTSYHNSIPGEFGKVSWVGPLANADIHLLDLEIASCDMFIDDGGDIYIIGSSDQANAKSLYKLPYGNYTNPQVLQTGLGRTWCLSKHGDHIYFCDQSSIKRFHGDTPGIVETFADREVMSMSFSAEHLYYADYFGGTIGRINLSTMADETLASGLNSPHAVRYDPDSYKVYFVEVGTSAGQFKNGTLKVIDLN